MHLIGETGINDPRAVPALLDRLEGDPARHQPDPFLGHGLDAVAAVQQRHGSVCRPLREQVGVVRAGRVV